MAYIDVLNDDVDIRSQYFPTNITYCVEGKFSL
jgi:hypothetical protein